MAGTAEGCCSLLRPILRKKNLDEARNVETPLHRCLSTWHIMFIGVAYTLGAGIFLLIGTVIHSKAGSASFISFLLASFTCAISGFSYIEFGTLIPKAGSSYIYTYLTLGELPAFIVGWTIVSDILVSIPTSAKSLSSTLDSLVGGAFTNFTIAYFGRLPESEYLSETYDFLAVALITLLVLINMVGARVSLSVNLILCALQCTFLTFIITCCFVYGSVENWTRGPGGFFPFGFAGVLKGTAVAFFAVSGFEAVLTSAEECKDPTSSIPKAVFGSILIVSVLHVVASLGLSYLVPYDIVNVASPYVMAFKYVGAEWIIYVVGVAVALSTGLSKLTGLYSLSRFTYAMASDGLLFPCFSYINENVKVPIGGLIFGWVLTSILALVVKLETLANLVSMATLFSYMAVGIDLFYLRFLTFQESDSKGQIVLSDICQLRPWANSLLSGHTLIRQRFVLKILFVIFIFLSFLAGLVLNLATPLLTWWSWVLTATVLLLVLLVMLLLSLYKPWHIEGMYESPLTPLPILLGIFLNAVLLLSLQLLTALRFLIWSALGLALYFTYGYWHSEVRKQQLSDYVQLDENKLQQEKNRPLDENSPLSSSGR